MRVGLFAVGRLKSGPEKDLAARYFDRFSKAGPAVGLEFSRVAEVAESRASNAETRKREEAGMLLKTLPEGGVLILLDEDISSARGPRTGQGPVPASRR